MVNRSSRVSARVEPNHEEESEEEEEDDEEERNKPRKMGQMSFGSGGDACDRCACPPSFVALGNKIALVIFIMCEHS